MKKTVYIFSNGEIKRKQNTIYFETEDRKRKYVPIESVSEIMIFGEVSLNKKLLEYLTQKEIIIHFFNYHNYYVGSYYPREHYNSGLVILKQAENYLDPDKRLLLAKKFVEGSIKNMLKVVSYYKNRGVQLHDIEEEMNDLLFTLDMRTSVDEVMAVEGNVRDTYYRGFDRIINNPDFRFEARTRRPPANRLNALISFGNSLLYVLVLSEIYRTHLDPRIGYLHSTNTRRFTLNLDVAEIFKPILVDRLIFLLLNKGLIKKSHFKNNLGGIYLKENGQKIFVKEWEKKLQSTIRHRGLGRNVSYRRLIRLELYKIEKHILGDKEYNPFVVRW